MNSHLTPGAAASGPVESPDLSRPPHPPGVVERFESCARANPDVTAAIFGDLTLTYAQLDDCAHRLAHRLRKLGAAPDVPVALLMDRGLDMLVALLATLKAGAAYVPLDPDHPVDRLDFILRDTGARLLLTRGALADRLGSHDAAVVRLDSFDAEGDGDRDPIPRPRPDDLAYILYTSGSTGRPKGVLVPHRGLANLLAAFAADPGFGPDHVMLAAAPLSFDIAAVDLLLPLVTGGTVAIVPADAARDGTRLLHALLHHRATTLQATPTTWRMLLDAGLPDGLNLRAFCGGEPLHPELARALFRRGVALWNMYGPTEATVCCAFHHVTESDLHAPTIPIGRALPGTRLHVLDNHLHPASPGEPGELCIAGPGVARGYLNRPDLTAERFIADPFTPGTLYRTGDRVRRREDGELEYLGRSDGQVKLRGHRIELGEIEAALAAHPGVAQCAVILREDRPGDPRLVAYIVPAEGQGATGFREYLKGRLPAAMVPAAFVLLNTMPRTEHGKIDRAALPAPEPGEREVVEPRRETERRLVKIWTELLGERRIGVEDDFFDLGGHSLTAARLASRVRSAMGVELAVAQVFEARTLGRLAAVIDAAGEAEVEPDLIGTPSECGGREPLSAAQRRLWFLDRVEPGRTDYNMLEVRRITGPLDPAAMDRAITALVARHDALRTTFGEQGGEPWQTIHPAAAMAVRWADLSAASAPQRDAEVGRRLRAERLHRFDLAAGPLVRFTGAKLAEGEHLLIVAVHHIVCDGWSVGVMFSELAAMYEAQVAGRAAALTPLTVRYADYAAWEAKQQSGARREQDENDWANLLGGEGGVRSLGRQHEAEQNRAAAEHVVEVGAEVMEAVRGLCRSEGASVAMALMGALKVLMWRQAAEAAGSVTVGMPIALRRRAELEGLVGLLLNTVAVRTEIGEGVSYREVLRRVRGGMLGAQDHAEEPFDRVVARVNPKRGGGGEGEGLFDVFFNCLNIPVADRIDAAGITMTDARPAEVEAAFGLTVYVEDRGGAVRLRWVYRTARYAAGRIEHLAAQMVSILEQAAEDPDRGIERLSLVTREARAMLADPAAEIAVPVFEPITRMIADVARRQPGEAAITQEGRTWSYAELDAAARRIARALAGRGIVRGDAVALAGERSFGLIAAMIGVLRARGVMVTLDGSLPIERRKTMVEVAGAKLLLRVGGEGDALDGIIPVLNIGTDGVVEAGEAAPEPGEPEPGDAAYVFFTSGTTGRPKGVLGCHRGLSHFVGWERGALGIGPGDRTGQLTGLSFDVVLRDIFLPLVSGATLCLPPGGLSAADGRGVVRWLERERVTLVHGVPSVAQAWIEGAGGAGGTGDGVKLSLRWVVFAGEPLWGTLVERWRERFGRGAGLVNLYGPTETTLAKCWWRVGEEAERGIQPVGAALPDSQAWVVNRWGGMCGVCEAGEIVIRTPMRSLGYLGASEAERSRFVANPFTGDAEDVVYRTGDRGWFDERGRLRIEGRMDDQVKVRGVRVEPAEVAAVLSEHPGVSRCVVVVRESEGGSRELAGYVVGREGVARLSEGLLRDFAKRRLAEAMVPRWLVVLDRMPLSANGKVDRGALPEPIAASEARSEAVGPRTPVESDLAAIWSELLGVERVGLSDDFFELGGHSLLAVRMSARIEAVLGVVVTVSEVFGNSTLERLAERVERGRLAAGEPVVMLCEGAGEAASKPPLLLLPGLAGHATALGVLARRLGGRRVYGLQPPGLDGVTEPLKRVEAIAEFLLDPVVRVVGGGVRGRGGGAYHLAGYSAGGLVAYEMARRLRGRGATVGSLSLIDAFGPGYPAPAAWWVRGGLFTWEAMRVLRREGFAPLATWVRNWQSRRAHGRLAQEQAKAMASHGGTVSAMIQRAAEAYNEARAHYRPGPYDGLITVFRSQERQRRIGVKLDDPAMGWATLARGGLECIAASGGHIEMMRPPHVGPLAEALARVMRAHDPGERRVRGELLVQGVR